MTPEYILEQRGMLFDKDVSFKALKDVIGTLVAAKADTEDVVDIMWCWQAMRLMNNGELME